MINQTKSVFTRVNGRGNAWPVFLGSTHPFYDTNDIRDLANASYSIIGMETEDYSTDFIDRKQLFSHILIWIILWELIGLRRVSTGRTIRKDTRYTLLYHVGNM